MLGRTKTAITNDELGITNGGIPIEISQTTFAGQCRIHVEECEGRRQLMIRPAGMPSKLSLFLKRKNQSHLCLTWEVDLSKLPEFKDSDCLSLRLELAEGVCSGPNLCAHPCPECRFENECRIPPSQNKTPDR